MWSLCILTIFGTIKVDNMEFLLLNTKLQNCYGFPGAESDLQIYSPVLSQACVALYDNKDWCRAQVTGVCLSE